MLTVFHLLSAAKVGGCVSGQMVKKKTNLGSHCCMTDSGWKCCNKGEACCSYTGSGQVEITGFRPVCCERGSYREKAECCANIKRTTGILPSCCKQPDLKPKCCSRWDGSVECCPIFGSCCRNNGSNSGMGRGVPIRRDPIGQTPARSKPTPSYNLAQYTKKAPMVPKCCLVYHNIPSCCYSLHQNPDCCTSRQQKPDRGETMDNQLSRSLTSQNKLKYCCTITRRTCCPKVTSSRISKLRMQPCCYSRNKPSCCYTSRAYTPGCCSSVKRPTGQASTIPPYQSGNVNQALEARYSHGRGDVPAQGGTRQRGVPIVTPGYRDNQKNTDYLQYNRRVNGNGIVRENIHDSNRWTGNTRINSGNLNAASNIRINEISNGNRYIKGESHRVSNERQFQENNKQITEDQRGQSNERKQLPDHQVGISSTIKPTTTKYTDDLQQGMDQNDIASYEHCCYLLDRRACCKEAYMATGTLPYCCSASVEKENMGNTDQVDWRSKQQHIQRPGYQSRIKISEPEPEPKFIPEYAPFGNTEHVISGIVSEIGINDIPSFEEWGKKAGSVPEDRNRPAIKAIVVDSHARITTTTEQPFVSEAKNPKQVTESVTNNNYRGLDYGRSHDLTNAQPERPDVSVGGRYPTYPHKEVNPASDNGKDFKGELDYKVRYDPTNESKHQNVGMITTDVPTSKKKETIPLLPTIYPVHHTKKPNASVHPVPRPYLNDSIYIPSNQVGQDEDIRSHTIKTEDSSPAGNENGKTSTTSPNEKADKPELYTKENVLFENEYQQPDTLDNLFPYIPAANNILKNVKPTTPAGHQPTNVNGLMPDFDSDGSNLRPDVYNYYMEGGEYPEYMMCGDEPYMMSVYICCDNVLSYRYGVTPRCCGTEAYDDFTYNCCDGIIKRSCDLSYP